MNQTFNFCFEDKFIETLDSFNDFLIYLKINDRSIKFIKNETNDAILELTLKNDALNNIFIDSIKKYMIIKKIKTIDIKNKDFLENLNLEIIDFFYNVNNLLLYVAEININHKPDKNDYYKANLLIKFCDVETITIYKTYS